MEELIIRIVNKHINNEEVAKAIAKDLLNVFESDPYIPITFEDED